MKNKVVCPSCKSKYVYYWVSGNTFECDDCNEQWQCTHSEVLEFYGKVYQCKECHKLLGETNQKSRR